MKRREFIQKVGLVGIATAAAPRAALAGWGDEEGCTDPLPSGLGDDQEVPQPGEPGGMSGSWKMFFGSVGATSGLLAGYSAGLSGSLLMAAMFPEPGSPTEGMAGLALGIVSLYYGAVSGVSGYLASDPPRLDYQQSAVPVSVDCKVAGLAAMGPRGIAHVQVLADEVSNLGALLDGWELLQGAQIAGDQKWIDIHTEDIHALQVHIQENGVRVQDAVKHLCGWTRTLIDPGILHRPVVSVADALAMPELAAAAADVSATLQPILEAGGRKWDLASSLADDGSSHTIREAVELAEEAAKKWCEQRVRWGCA